jgi:hypothetical protein
MDDLSRAFDAESAQEMDMDIDVMFHAQHITRLHLQEPTGAQYEKAMAELERSTSAYAMERFKITLIAQVARVDRAVVLGMKKSQIEAAFSFLSRLLDDGQKTGAS